MILKSILGLTGLGMCIMPLALNNVEVKSEEMVMPEMTNIVKKAQRASTGNYHFVVNVNDMLSIEEILSHVEAIDETDGNVAVSYEAGETTYNPSNKKVGKYELLVYAEDEAGNRAEELVYITVADIDKPIISGTQSYRIRYNEPTSAETIKGSLLVSDNYDSNLTINIKEDNYDGNERILGNHTITYNTTDTSGNISNDYVVTIDVYDDIKPVITAPETINLNNAGTEITLEELKEQISVEDDLEGTLSYEISGFENYESNKTTVGNYPIIISASDSSDNEATKQIILQVKDANAPVITGPETITLSNNGLRLTLEVFKAKFNVNDAVDGVISDFSVSGFDEYLENQDIVGTYTVTITAQDKSGNQVTKQIKLVVEDKIAPEIIFDDYFILVTEGQELSKEQIYEMASRVLGIDEASILSIDGMYDLDEVGNYNLTVNTADGSYGLKLSVVANTVVPTVDETNTFNPYWYIAIAGGILLLGIAGVLIYKKRKQA